MFCIINQNIVHMQHLSGFQTIRPTQNGQIIAEK